jgi:hypothetical protein
VAGLKVGVVTRDEDMRLHVARAFDHAPAAWSVTLHDSVPGDVDVVVFGPDVEANGGIVFDPFRPGDVVGAIAAEVESRGSAPTVVTSAGGGTGVTTLALHLATASAQGANTCLVEAEALSGAALRLGFEQGFYKTWAGLEANESPIDAALPVSGGFRILLAPQAWAGEELRTALRAARAAFDAVIVDVPFSCPWPLVPGEPFTGIVVMTPTVPSAHRTRAFLEVHCDGSWTVVANRVGAGGETTRVELQGILERKIALELPCTPGLRDAEDEGRLLRPGVSRYARNVARLARALRSS